MAQEPNVVASRDLVVDVLHGQRVLDPYRWLEDGESGPTQSWVEANNQRTRSTLDGIASRPRWHERLVALVAVVVEWPVAMRGDRLFVQSRTATQPQPVVSLASVSNPQAPRRQLLNPAELADDGAVAIDWLAPSRDGRLLAYGVSEGGTENSMLRILDVDSGAHHVDEIPNTRACSLSWLPDRTAFLYTRYPEGENYNRRVYRHLLGADWVDDELVWGDLPVPDAWPSVSVHPNASHVLVHVGVGWSRTDAHLYDCRAGTWSTIIAGVDNNVSLSFDGERLVGTTDIDAPRGRGISVAINDPTGTWETLVPEGNGVVESVWRVGSNLYASSVASGVRRLDRHALDGAHIQSVVLPAMAELSGIASEHSSDQLVLSVVSFTLPSRLYTVTPGEPVQPFGQGPDLPFVPDDFSVSRRSYTSLDGTTIGLFVVHRADVVPSAQTRCWLGGYGGFNIASTPAYSAAVVAWCEAGGMYALAGLRGGNEEGEDWHRAGMREHKQNVFDDFHAAADFLVRNKMTSRDRLAIRGGSNGGLLVGAALTQRPDLCAAVVCEVPLLDMVRFPQFLIARLWTHEYGDPDVADEFGWLYAYSPYHHVVKGQAYPPVLMVTAAGDTRVDPLHARKMAALLQWAGADVLFKQDGRSGHGVGKPQTKIADDGADVLAFLDSVLAP